MIVIHSFLVIPVAEQDQGQQHQQLLR